MNKCIPKATIPPRRNRPWLSKRLIQAIRKKNILYKRAKITSDFSKYKSHRNRVTRELRNAKKAFFRKLNPKHSREFWKVYKALSSSSSTIPVLTSGDSIARTNKEKAELLNKFLYPVLTHLTLLFRTQILKSNPVVTSRKTCYVPRNLSVSSFYLLMYLSLVGLTVILLRCSNTQQSTLHQLLHLYSTSPLKRRVTSRLEGI